MSRCFPYHPPGYENKIRGNEERLIKSIKLQKEKERAKMERRKEKKREKREGSGEDPLSLEHIKEHDKKRKHSERSQLNNKGGYCTKVREDAAEQLEKSDLSEERGPPSFIRNQYDSDGTHDYSKRQKHAPDDIIHQNHGVPLRIRLPLMKHRDAEPPKTKELEALGFNDQPYLSGRFETPDELDTAVEITHSNTIPASSRRIRKAEGRFRDLIVDWTYPVIELERSDIDDLAWLIGRREQKHNLKSQGCKVWAKGLGSGSPGLSLQQRACHLPDVDIYVLSYVVPY